MRRYVFSRFAVFAFVVLVGAAAFVSTSYGQTAAPAAGGDAAAAPQPEEEGKIKILTGLIFKHPDFVTFTIGALSVIGLHFIIQGFMKNRASVFMPDSSTEQIRQMIQEKKFKELIEFTETDPSFVSRALNPALKRAPSFSSMKEAMETAIGEQTAEQFRKIEFLNIIGNLGPLLGLLGTVLGMIEAFTAMQRAGGNASPDKLAGGISTALCHTFLGLLLAVPCLACFGILRTIVDRLTVRGALVAEELLLMVKPAETKPPVRPVGAATPQPVRKAPAIPAPSPVVSG